MGTGSLQGDGSEVIVDEAMKFITKQVATGTPVFVVIWYSTDLAVQRTKTSLPFSAKLIGHLHICTVNLSQWIALLGHYEKVLET